MKVRSLLLALLAASILLLPLVLAQDGEPAGGDAPEGDDDASDTAGGAGSGGRGGASNRSAERGGAGRSAHEREAAGWANLSEGARTKGLARAEEARLFGKLDITDGVATGRFVSFNLTGPDVSDYTVRDTAAAMTARYFTRIDATGFGEDGEPVVRGAALRLDGDDGAELSVHNTPTAILTYRAGNATLDVELLVPADVTLSNETGRTMALTANGSHGHLVLQGNATMQPPVNGSDGQRLSVRLDPGSALMFMAHPSRSLVAQNIHKLRDAIADERVGGILTLVKADGAPVQDRVFLGVDMEATSLGPNRAEVVVRSDDPAGKVVVLNLDSTVLATFSGDNVAVTLDNQSVSRADSSVVLNATTPLFHVERHDGGVQVLVHVPSFSDHTLVVSSDGSAAPTGAPTGETAGNGAPQADNDAPAPPLALVLVAASLAAWAVARRR